MKKDEEHCSVISQGYSDIYGLGNIYVHAYKQPYDDQDCVLRK